MQFDAIIFDLDGVICSTDRYHYLAWKSVADELELPFDETMNHQLRGISRMESLEILLSGRLESLTEAQKQQIAARKNTRYQALLARMAPHDLDPQVQSTLDALRAAGLRLAIGSSSQNAPLILRKLGLAHYFDAVADGNQVSRSKPDPQVFLLAAQLVHTPANRCLVVEDAISGVRAGRAAGMRVACVGDAAAQQAGDWNLQQFSELLHCVIERG